MTAEDSLLFDREGRLIVAGWSTRTVWRLEHDGTLATLASHFEGRKLNTPNGAVNMTSHSETKFDGDTAYRTEGHMKYEPAVMGQSEMAMTSSGRWVGECPAGQKPGDMVMPNGSTMNIKDMQHH